MTTQLKPRRLTRSLSTPRRCNGCNKMVYFTAIRCKECGNVAHESCAIHCIHQCTAASGIRRRSYQPSTENSTEDVFEKCITPTLPELECASVEGGADPSNGISMSGLLKVVHWLSQRRRSREFSKANAADKHVRSKFGLNQDTFDEKVARKRLKSLLKSAHLKRNSYSLTSPTGCDPNSGSGGDGTCSQLLQRQTSLTYSSRQAFFVSPNNSLSSSGCMSSASSVAQTPSDTETEQSRRTSGVQKQLSCEGSTSRASDVSIRTFGGGAGGALLSLVKKRGSDHSPRQRGLYLSSQGRFGRQCFTKARTVSIETKQTVIEKLCDTWPPAGMKTVNCFGEFLDDNESGIGDCETLDHQSRRSQCTSVKDTLGEWSIPFGDLEFKECIRHGRDGDVHRGKWHGEILIYTCHRHREVEVQQFMNKVAQMSMIRHENILLFMGACVDPPNLAIITSMKKGPSLYEQIHHKQQRLALHTKFNIARQVAQGMGYLHAKGIIHENLTSKNVILESRVKLCIMDQGVADRKHDRPDYGCIPRGQLSYLSPELMRSLEIDPPQIRHHLQATQESNVYAFGSLLYEILAENYPFHNYSSHAIIWSISVGRQENTDTLKCTTGLKTLLLECWSRNPEHRPTFSYISRQLQENVSLHRRHSSSEPERLNRIGVQNGHNLCG